MCSIYTESFVFLDDEERQITTHIDYVVQYNEFQVILRNIFNFNPSMKHYMTLCKHFMKNYSNVEIIEHENTFVLVREFSKDQQNDEKDNLSLFFNENEMDKFNELLDLNV